MPYKDYEQQLHESKLRSREKAVKRREMARQLGQGYKSYTTFLDDLAAAHEGRQLGTRLREIAETAAPIVYSDAFTKVNRETARAALELRERSNDAAVGFLLSLPGVEGWDHAEDILSDLEQILENIRKFEEQE